MRHRLTAAALVACFLSLALWYTQVPGVQGWQRGQERRASRPSNPRVRVSAFIENGGRLDWSQRNNLIAFDRRLGNDATFDIFTINPSGTNEICLTCGKKDRKPPSSGNPAWHPSGDYIVFQGRNNHRGWGSITDYFANPGMGINNDIWVMDKNGRRFWQLTTVKPRVGGVLHPQFSPAGDKLLWSERVSTKGPLGSWGEWALRVADFRITPNGVRIENERLLQPGVQQRMYESHGFSPDGEQILFSGNLDRGQDETGADIYLFNLRTNKLTNLTQTLTEWDEHAHFSPDGKTILWMSSKDLPHWRKAGEVLTDYWLMNADGSNKRRITYFNTQGHDEYIAEGLSAADAAWSPDGTRIAGYLLTDVKKGGKIVMIDMR